MVVRVARCVVVAAALFLAGCGGDPVGNELSGRLVVSSGGTGSIFFARTGTSLSFADSVTVAIRGQNDRSDQWTLYTLFGLSQLNLREVPSAALVTFVDGLEPDVSGSTFLPSSVIAMALHTGFNRGAVSGSGDLQQILAQDAPQVFEQTSNGTFILEPSPNASGGFVDQNSTNRRARWATVTLTDLDNGDEALLEGGVDFQLSAGSFQEFLGYAGNLGLNDRPSQSGGGPPPPPGTGGTGGGSGNGGNGGSGGTDGPPAPPL